MFVRIARRYERQRQSEAGTPQFAWRGAVLKRTGETPVPLQARGFTLIELILIMALLVIGVSFITPHLQGFFRGRTLQFEARQMIALMHNGQTRAVSGGVPMDLWFDIAQNKYGLEEEPGYNETDPKAEKIDLNENLKIEIPEGSLTVSQPTSDLNGEHAGMPKITFLPDGSIAETSPRTVRIVDSAGPVLLVTQTRDRNQYEITTTTDQQ